MSVTESSEAETTAQQPATGSSRTSAIEGRIVALERERAATDELRTQTARLRARGSEQLRATLRAQRERAQSLAAQVRELKRAVALLRERVGTMTPSPSS